MIVDNHVHIFPYLGGNSEYESEKVQLMYAQKIMSRSFFFEPTRKVFFGEPTRKLEDYSIVNEVTLWDRNKPGPEGIRNVNFRAGKFGRYEWTVNGINYCKQYMPVSLQDMAAPPELVIAQMNCAGVDKAVLQRSHIYGKLENYYKGAIEKWPDRFIGLTQIDESRACYDDQISELHRGIEQLGLKGLYFEPAALFVGNFRHNFDDEIFTPFWKEVDCLSIPVYAQTDKSEFLDQMKRWKKILEKHPGTTLVISLGLREEVAWNGSKPHIPDLVHHLVTEYKVFLEVAYPISIGMTSDYPYPKAQELVRHLFDTFGPKKLIWGSDMPNVERYCTYSQSLTCLTHYCDFLSDSDKELILGKNVLTIFSCVSR